MATNRIYLNYDIYLSDPALVATYKATSWPPYTPLRARTTGYIIRAPDTAAVDFSAPIVLTGAPLATNHISSRWFVPVASLNFPRNVAKFQLKAGAFIGQPTLGATLTFFWKGNFVSKSSTGTVAMSQRRWIDGGNLPSTGAGGTASGDLASRAAARSVGGWGYALRDSALAQRAHRLDDFAASAAQSWERFYVRPRRFPDAAAAFWQCHGGPTSSASGVIVRMLPTGQIAVYNNSSANVETLQGTTAAALVLNTWHKIDILVDFAAGVFKLYVNGALVLNPAFPANVGLTQASNGLHASSHICGTDSNSQQLGLDVADWINAAWPTDFAAQLDWLNGSKIVHIKPTGDAATRANWTGIYSALLQQPVPSTGMAEIGSTTALAILGVTTDAATEVDNLEESLGISAMVFAVHARRAGAINGRLGYSLAGAAAVMASAGTQNTSLQWQTLMYRPSGLLNPIKPIAPLELYFEKDNSANAAFADALQAEVECIGQFGPEDSTLISPTVPARTPIGMHNAPYARTPWANRGTAPISPVIVHAGTYVGDGVGQNLTFRVPVHWLYIRPLTGDVGGTHWWSSLLSAHKGIQQATRPDLMVQAVVDPTFVPTGALGDQELGRTVCRLVFNDAQNNAAGVTYQYVAISDPGQRFLLNGALRYWKGTGDFVNALDDETFTPIAAFFWREFMNATTTANEYYKGPGHSADASSQLSAAETAATLQFGLGTITSKSAFHISGASEIG
ncbi:MAG TPA: hypothetical protein VK506_05795, partial [Conexibacter sp.]|nr:hypothetical protein [Conexibacter sp.]